MKNRPFLFGCIVIALSVSAAAGQTPRATLDQYCVTCHNERTKTANLTLDKLDLSRVSENAEVWEKVVRKLRAGMMPPAGARRPDPATRQALMLWLENEIDRNAEQYLPPKGLHRLNRTEYANVVRDLLNVEVDVTTLLPTDDSSYGFDNIAGTLGLSSTLVEAYISAAGKISRLAIGSVTSPTQVTYRVPEDTSQDYHIEGMPFGTRGGILVRHGFPADGEYTVTVLGISGDNMSPQPFGSVPGEKIEILLDGERMQLLDWNGARTGGNGAAPMRVRFKTTAGSHTVGATFLETNLAPTLDIDRHFERDTIQTGPFPGFTFFPHVGSIRIDGPENGTAAQSSPSRSRIFVCRPSGIADETPCARRILSNLATHAFRRPATADEISGLLAFYETGRSERDFDHGIELALQRILADPKFVFRMEAEPAGVDYGQVYRVTDLELASRLSFFLWSTSPDDELVNLATQGKLKDPAVLEQQVQRMLKDPRAEALAVNFAGQWLNLRGLQSTGPLPMLYPDFDDPLRLAMRREVELLFDSIVREDRDVIELLTADYTFVNERLAKHYGIPNVYGSRFQRVTLGESLDVRRGLLGKGAILTTTSKPERNSPVTRGKWVLTNILGISPPDPPPDVPALEATGETTGSVKELSMRQKMINHRIRPDCMQCHSLMDPIGFALENFDGIAAWRTQDEGNPIVVQDPLYDGAKVDGPAGLRQWLLGYSDQFVRVVTEKLLTYALGRGVEYRDMPLVRSIVRDAARNNNRFSAVIMGIIKSNAFQMNMKIREAAVR